MKAGLNLWESLTGYKKKQGRFSGIAGQGLEKAGWVWEKARQDLGKSWAVSGVKPG